MNRFSREGTAQVLTPSTPGLAGGARPTGPTEGSATAHAQQLLEDVSGLGTRVHLTERQAQKTDRRVAAYASRLARHTARLLQHMPTAVPAVRPVAGTGASSLRHYILKHEQLTAPDRTRLLVVSSDGRLRVCTVVVAAGPTPRLWIDYEVANPPAGLGLSVVFHGLSAMIVQLEAVVAERERRVTERGAEIDGLIEHTEAALAGRDSHTLPVAAAPLGAGITHTDGAGADRDPNDLRSYGFEDRRALIRPLATIPAAIPVTLPAPVPGSVPGAVPGAVPVPVPVRVSVTGAGAVAVARPVAPPQPPGILRRLWR